MTGIVRVFTTRYVNSPNKVTSLKSDPVYEHWLTTQSWLPANSNCIQVFLIDTEMLQTT